MKALALDSGQEREKRFGIKIVEINKQINNRKV